MAPAAPGGDRDDPLDRQLPAPCQRRVVRLAAHFAEREERLQLSAGPPIQLSPRTVEREVAHERDGQDVGGDLPGLIRQDAHVHVEGFLRRDGSGRPPGRGVSRLSVAFQRPRPPLVPCLRA